MSGKLPNSTGQNQPGSICDWLDQIPFSRPKRHLARDFSDAVLAAEVVKHFFPKLVELHNYPGAQCISRKNTNWTTLNEKVLKKLGYRLTTQTIQQLSLAQRETTEKFLNTLRLKIEKKLKESKPENKPLTQQQQQRIRSLYTNLNRTCENFSSQKMMQPCCQSGSCYSSIPNAGGDAPPENQFLPETFDFVPRAEYDHKLQEVLERDEIIHVLREKIKKLEYTLQFRDITIGRHQQLLEQLKRDQQQGDGLWRDQQHGDGPRRDQQPLEQLKRDQQYGDGPRRDQQLLEQLKRDQQQGDGLRSTKRRVGFKAEAEMI